MSHDIAQFSEDVVTKLKEEDYPLKLLSESDGLNDLLQSIECGVIVAGASEPTIADLSLMKCLRDQQQLTEVIVISIGEDVSNAVKLMKAGNFDVLPLPINPSHLQRAIDPHTHLSQ
jgi:DNA-binding NtrC family response regulator